MNIKFPGRFGKNYSRVGTVRRMESFEGEVGSRTSTLSKVQAALERAGVEFLGGEQPGVRLRKQPGRPGTGGLGSPPMR